MNRLLSAALFSLALVPVVAAGCGTEECVGGVYVDGVCEGRCDPSKCVDAEGNPLEGNVCVGNRCALVCDAHTDCFAPFRGGPSYQACSPAKADGPGSVNPDTELLDPNTGLNEGDDVNICVNVNVHPSIGALCALGNECDGQFACPNGAPCTQGTDNDDCPAAQCRSLTCRTAGEGDALSYCTTFDCQTDADCAPGLYCGITRLPQNICGTDKGDEDPCVDPSTFSNDGQTFREGPISLLRNICLKREQCAPCASSADCSLADDLQCVQIGESTHCAKTCLTDDDCFDDHFCAGASGETPGFCVPRTSTCKPAGNFCEACLNDLDCAGGGPTMYCDDSLSGGQRACFDATFPDSCTSDAQCPESPSGNNGECLDEGEGVSSGSSVYHRCYFPFFSGPSKFQCWPD